MESRIDVRAKAQAFDLADDSEARSLAQQQLREAELTLERLTALRDIATPDIFNSADTLNAYNLIGLANEQILSGKTDAADQMLQRARAILQDKLLGYDQARDLVFAEVATDSDKGQSQVARALVPADRLRQDFQSAARERRQLAAATQARMVTIPGGSFQMGDVANVGNPSERPVHTVLVPEFELSAYELTHAEYQVCVADGGCAPAGQAGVRPDQLNLPVTGLSWFDAQDYVVWLSAKTGEPYRLPTEAEWEYAARSASTNVYPWGDTVAQGQANCINCGSPWDGLSAAPVGTFKPNGFGLHDMAGNVWEWTADCWYADYNGAPAIAIARGDNAICTERVLRGGSWENDAWLARTTYRGRGLADMHHDLYGVRIAKTID